MNTLNPIPASVSSTLHFFPFGMLMPLRSYTSESYRYGFNGMEKDDEVKGSGNSLDFGARIYDSRLGRWLSVDPLWKQFSGLSSYQFANNRPTFFIDIDGNENIVYLINLNNGSKGPNMNEIKVETEKYLNNAGLDNVKVVIWTPGSEGEVFDMRYKDKSDAVVLIGNKTEAVNYSLKMGEQKFANQIKNELDVELVNRERDGLLVVDFNNANFATESKADGSAFTIVHGIGAHLGGVENNNLYIKSDGHVKDNSMYATGNDIINYLRANPTETLETISKNEDTKSHSSKIKDKFFTSSVSIDNYYNKKQNDTKTMPGQSVPLPSLDY